VVLIAAHGKIRNKLRTSQKRFTETTVNLSETVLELTRGTELDHLKGAIHATEQARQTNIPDIFSVFIERRNIDPVSMIKKEELWDRTVGVARDLHKFHLLHYMQKVQPSMPREGKVEIASARALMKQNVKAPLYVRAQGSSKQMWGKSGVVKRKTPSRDILDQATFNRVIYGKFDN